MDDLIVDAREMVNPCERDMAIVGYCRRLFTNLVRVASFYHQWSLAKYLE